MANDLVQINNTLSSTAEDEALTAAQGKILDEKKVTGSVGSTPPTSDNFSENNAVYFQYNASNNNTLIQTLLNAVYPIGCYYWSSDSTNPGTLFGGTWTQVKDKFVLAAGDTYTVGGTGGTATISYTPGGTVGNTTLTVNQIPSHNHVGKIGFAQDGYGGWIGGYAMYIQSNGSLSGGLAITNSTYNNTNKNTRNLTYTSNTGGSGAHNHEWTGTAATLNKMPPYIVAYCWRRTA